jgi:hypothetical protein
MLADSRATGGGHRRRHRRQSERDDREHPCATHGMGNGHWSHGHHPAPLGTVQTPDANASVSARCGASTGSHPSRGVGGTHARRWHRLSGRLAHTASTIACSMCRSPVRYHRQGRAHRLQAGVRVGRPHCGLSRRRGAAGSLLVIRRAQRSGLGASLGARRPTALQGRPHINCSRRLGSRP